LVSEEDFKDNGLRMDSSAEEKEEEKIKHRDLLLKEIRESSMKKWGGRVSCRLQPWVSMSA
jgi:hypothetical protein